MPLKGNLRTTEVQTNVNPMNDYNKQTHPRNLTFPQKCHQTSSKEEDIFITKHNLPYNLRIVKKLSTFYEELKDQAPNQKVNHLTNILLCLKSQLTS